MSDDRRYFVVGGTHFFHVRELPASSAICAGARCGPSAGGDRVGATLEALLDCIHFNPVKHGLGSCPHAWPASSFLR